MIRYRFKNFLKKLALASSIFATPFICSTQSALPQEPSFDLWAKESTIWKSRNISVCWENPSSNFANEMNWVQDSVINSWQSISLVNFQGWGSCSTDSKGIRIQINDEGPHVKGLGSDLDGLQNGMVLNFTFNNWDQSCRNGSERCIRLIAIHEFGHALGFAHEQNRPDTPSKCATERQGSDGDLLIGAWDLNSVMNYCNPSWNGDGKLSATDIQGVQALYGARGISQGCFYVRSLNNNFRNTNFKWLDAASDGRSIGLVNGQSHGTVWRLENTSQGSVLRSDNRAYRSLDTYRWLDGMSNGRNTQLVTRNTHGSFWNLEQDQGGFRIRSLNNNFRNQNLHWLDGGSDGKTIQIVNGKTHGTLWKLDSTSCSQ
jgi:hypothetical protein